MLQGRSSQYLNILSIWNIWNIWQAEKCSRDGALNITEFTSLCKTLFKNEQGTPYEVLKSRSNEIKQRCEVLKSNKAIGWSHCSNLSQVDSQTVVEIFNIFNSKGDGLLNNEEFSVCWKNWIKKILKPRSALIVVDVQNDFISGSLAISNCPAGHNGEDVVAPINHMLDKIPFTMICYRWCLEQHHGHGHPRFQAHPPISLDWHPTDHVSFDDNAHLRKIAAESKVQVLRQKWESEIVRAFISLSFLQDPNSINPFDVVVFEAHGEVPKMEQAMWPRHCVQVEQWYIMI